MSSLVMTLSSTTGCFDCLACYLAGRSTLQSYTAMQQKFDCVMQNEMDLSMTISVVGCMHCVGCPECMALPVELPSLVKPRIAQRMSELPQISESSVCASRLLNNHSRSSETCRMHSKKKTQGRQTPSALQAAQLTECITKEER